MKTIIWRWLGPGVGVVLFALAVWVLHRELAAHHIRDILQEFGRVPAGRILAALFLTASSYLIMTGYDLLALRYIRHPLGYGNIAQASFVGFAFSNSIGLSMLAGASVRYRLYSAWGLSGVEITKIVFFCTLSLWLGFFFIGGAVFTAYPMPLLPGFHLPFASTRPLGLVLLLLTAAYFAASIVIKRPVKIRDWDFKLPALRIFAPQILIASADWLLAAGVLYVLLPPSPGLSWHACLGFYLLAQLAGLLSQVPGGLGVFETVFLMLLPDTVPAAGALGSLLAYRALYYLLPLVAAASLLALHEVIVRRDLALRVAGAYRRWSAPLLAPVLSLATFGAGAVLLLSGATPALHERLLWLKRFVPLPLLEISHLLGSTIGMALLLLARGLQRRLDGAYWVTLVLLGFGIATSLAKGLDYEEATVLALVLLALVPSRTYFYRRASLLDQRFTPAWMAAIAIVFVCAAWLGVFSHQRLEFSTSLLGQFAFSAHAPRFLRAMAGAAAVLLLFAVARLLHPSRPKAQAPSPTDSTTAAAIVRGARSSAASLALLGDKSFLFNQDRTALVMFAVEGRSWVSMGDPVGPESEWQELIWRFRELSDRYGGWTVFYQVGAESLHRYLELGLTLTKLGEAARVPLTAFSLEGGARRGLRQTQRKLERDGCRFEIVPREAVSPLLPDLKSISDAWLGAKNTREKGFSLGCFDAAYLQCFDIALVKKENAPIAFANLWQSAENEELSVDLMRHDPQTAPNGVMDYLFVEIMRWGKQQGYRWFDLGMAPLAGLEDHALAPFWNRLASFVARHGEHFYNFQGLRQYKDKFDPLWQPKYLASPGGLALPKIMSNLAGLISGGLRGVVVK